MKGVLSILLYKDARVDQRILDETFGIFGWKRSHQCIDGNLYCTVEIYDKESKEWVAKQDVGAAGFAEKEKSQASDSFKRAAFNWGIGRELYSAPFIWIPADRVNIQKKGERFYCNEHFSVAYIAYNGDREITSLVIKNEKGQIMYESGTKKPADGKKKVQRGADRAGTISAAQIGSLKAELERTGVSMETVRGRYQIQEPESMSEELYNKVMLALSKTKTAGAA